MIAALLLLLPFSDVAVALVNRLVTALATPERLPRLDFGGGIPASERTMVIVPTLFTSVDGVRALLEQLEVRRSATSIPHLHFALLSDFADADGAAPAGGRRAGPGRGATGIEALNRQPWAEGGDRFFLFHRERRGIPASRRWMGWERKRGKIEEFNRLLRGATDTSFVVEVGALDVLPSIRYCLTLDSDTRLPRDAARALVGIIAHPLNRPRVDRRARPRRRGLRHPAAARQRDHGQRRRLAVLALYAGHTGVDPYTTAVSDVYQDLFGEGIFTGKGLYDVDAFQAVLEGRVPENAVLSHDLFEGLYARTALVSDVEVVDDYPSSVLAHTRRLHRWVRGDWQILWWLFPVVPIARRARAQPAAAHLALEDLRQPAAQPGRAGDAGAAAARPGPCCPAPGGLDGGGAGRARRCRCCCAAPRRRSGCRGGRPGGVSRVPLGRRRDRHGAASRCRSCSSPTPGLSMLHAIALTLVRLVVTRRRLLEWETAAATAAPRLRPRHARRS